MNLSWRKALDRFWIRCLRDMPAYCGRQADAFGMGRLDRTGLDCRVAGGYRHTHRSHAGLSGSSLLKQKNVPLPALHVPGLKGREAP